MNSEIYASNKTNKIDYILQFIVTLLLILSSKTVFWGIVYAEATLFVTLCFCIILLCWKRKKISMSNRNIKTLFLFSIFFIILMLMFMDDIQKNFNGYVGAVIYTIEVFIIGMFAVTALDKEKFIRNYVHIISVLCVISLVFFSLSVINRDLTWNIIKEWGINDNTYIAIPIHTFGWETSKNYSYIFERNAGIWWEPGAFQGFIMIAILFTITQKQYFKKAAWMIIIFLITLISTQSTAGYIILILSLIGFNTEYIDSIFPQGITKNKKMSRPFFVFVGVLFAFLLVRYILSTGNIDNKLSDDSASYLSRMDDILSSIKLILKHPVIGIGLGESGQVARETVVSTTTATTILYLASVYGIPLAVVYLYKFYKGTLSVITVNNTFQIIIIEMIFTVILMTETLHLLPIYAMFLYEWTT